MGRHTTNITDLFLPLNSRIFHRFSGLFHVPEVSLPVIKMLKGKCSFCIQFEAPFSFFLQPAHIRHLQKGEGKWSLLTPGSSFSPLHSLLLLAPYNCQRPRSAFPESSLSTVTSIHQGMGPPESFSNPMQHEVSENLRSHLKNWFSFEVPLYWA